MRESLRHCVTTHNWFAHYLWDIYGGFGHNGNITQRTLPSHTQPSRSKLTVWASIRKPSCNSEGKHVHESLRHGVTSHNWFAHYIWDIYGGFGHNGNNNSMHPSLPYSAIMLQIDCLGQILKLHTLQEQNIDVKVSDILLPPITGLCALPL